jgi:hypothetical protein
MRRLALIVPITAAVSAGVLGLFDAAAGAGAETRIAPTNRSTAADGQLLLHALVADRAGAWEAALTVRPTADSGWRRPDLYLRDWTS